MSLQGTLRTLGITEVLEFLADRSATGRLDITAEAGSATYWMLRGEVADVDYAFERESGTDAAESTYYALSELDGTFFFDEGQAPEHRSPTETVADVLGRTADIAEGWSLVEELIPSPRHQLLRSDSLDGSVTIEPAWWQAIEAIGSGCSSRTMADTLGMRALAASTMAADMARVGLIRVEEPLPEPEPANAGDDSVGDTGAPLEDESIGFSAEPSVDESAFLSTLPAPPTDVFAPAPEMPAAAPEPMLAEPMAEQPLAAPQPDPAPAGDALRGDAWGAVPATDPHAAPGAPPWDAGTAEQGTTSWDAPPNTETVADSVANAPAWDAPAPLDAADDGWGVAPAAVTSSAQPEPVVTAAPVIHDEDDGWASDHSLTAAPLPTADAAPSPGAAPADDAAAALASWGVPASPDLPSMPTAPAPMSPAEPAPAAPVAASPALAPESAPEPAFDPFADLPSEAELAAAPSPEPAPAPEPAELAAPDTPGYQAPPSQAAVFGSAPPAPSPYAPDAAPPGPGTIAAPAGTVDQLASLEDLDDEEDEAFGTDDRSSVLKFLRRD